VCAELLHPKNQMNPQIPSTMLQSPKGGRTKFLSSANRLRTKRPGCYADLQSAVPPVLHSSTAEGGPNCIRPGVEWNGVPDCAGAMKGPQALERFNALQIKNLRYSRLQICATFSANARKRFEEFRPAPWPNPITTPAPNLQASSVTTCGLGIEAWRFIGDWVLGFGDSLGFGDWRLGFLNGSCPTHSPIL
jgi:hypothetical protein